MSSYLCFFLSTYTMSMNTSFVRVLIIFLLIKNFRQQKAGILKISTFQPKFSILVKPASFVRKV